MRIAYITKSDYVNIVFNLRHLKMLRYKHLDFSLLQSILQTFNSLKYF